MPVENRLRSALTDNAAEIRPDVEHRLAAVRHRRTRRRIVLCGSLAAAAAAVTLGVGLLLLGDAADPQPPGPVSADRVSDVGETVPLGRYVRWVTAQELRSAGYRDGYVLDVSAAGDRVRAVMTFREDRDGPGGANAWLVDFVDQEGRRFAGEAGAFSYGERGELTTWPTTTGPPGAPPAPLAPEPSSFLWWEGTVGRYEWEVGGRRLVLHALPGTTMTQGVSLLEGGTWLRRAP